MPKTFPPRSSGFAPPEVILLDPAARPIIGHRGASGSFPENTLLAFERAIARGADALELDVRGSADGVPVVIHDATVDRTTSGTGSVASLTLPALQALDAGRGQRIPTLREVLARFGSATPLIIEIKAAECAERVARLIEYFGLEQSVLVGSFHRAALAPFARPPFCRAATRAETGWCLAISRVGLAPRRPVYQAFTVPERHGWLRIVDRRFVRAAHRRGIPVHVWTVNEPAHAARLRRLGVNGIITNNPERMGVHSD